jgi:hypothetical protein
MNANARVGFHSRVFVFIRGFNLSASSRNNGRLSIGPRHGATSGLLGRHLVREPDNEFKHRCAGPK